jgi:predicted dienelactone hydrolase
MLRALFLLLAASLASSATAAGFQYAGAPDGNEPALELAIWYPSDAPTSSQPLGLFTQEVAFNGAVKGNALPLIVISHGTGGSAAGHYDTALALANAGFVVVAPSHSGDNYKDRSRSFTAANFTGRARQTSRVIDFMLGAWNGHDRLDPARIGMFGHSAGAATALIVIGGNPSLYLAALFCRDHPEAWSCQQLPAKGDQNPHGDVDPNAPDWHHDPRVKAAVLAAPALGYTFSKVGLENVTAPVQLWRAESDKITPDKWYGDIVRDSLPTPPEDHLVPNAGHFDFLAPCSDALAKLAPEICVSALGFDRAAFHRDMNEAVVAFFKAQLAPP